MLQRTIQRGLGGSSSIVRCGPLANLRTSFHVGRQRLGRVSNTSDRRPGPGGRYSMLFRSGAFVATPQSRATNLLGAPSWPLTDSPARAVGYPAAAVRVRLEPLLISCVGTWGRASPTRGCAPRPGGASRKPPVAWVSGTFAAAVVLPAPRE
jgi:hypothetical protein